MNPVKQQAIIGFVRSVLVCAVLFGLALSNAQTAALVLTVEAGLVLIAALRQHQNVAPVEREEQEQLDQG